MKALEQFKQSKAAEQQAADENFQKLVSKLASSDRKTADRVTQQQIAEALDATGKSLDELQAAVAKEKRRLELWQTAKNRPAAVQRLQKAETEAAAFNKRYQQTQRDLRDESLKFHGAVRVARGQLGDINAAVTALEALTGEPVIWPDDESEAA